MEKNVNYIIQKRLYIKPNMKLENVIAECCIAAGSPGTNQIIVQNTIIESVWEEEEINGGIQF